MKVLFYYDQFSDPGSIAGGVCVVLRSLVDEISTRSTSHEFTFSGNLISKAAQVGAVSLVPVSTLTEQELKNFDVIIAIDRIAALRPIWQSLGSTKRILYMHSWEIQEHPAFFDIVVCLSDSHRQWLSSNGMPIEKISVIGNGVDFSGFVEEIDVTRRRHSLLSVGAVIEHKGTHIILEAAKKLKAKIPDLSLTVLGSASLWNQKDQYEKSLRSSAPSWVVFADPVPRSKLAGYYASHSIICSASKLETYGLVAVEAQGFGCIPVSYDVGGVSATMQNGLTGRLYKPNTPEALLSTLEQTFSDISAGVILRENAVNFARSQQSVSRMLDAWLDLLERKVRKPKAKIPEDIYQAGFSFCIITAGKRADKLQKLIDSIRSQNLKKYEIIIAGKLPFPIEGISLVSLELEAASGQVAIMRNRAMQSASYETIVMCDDDIILDPGFADAIAQFGKEFNILCVRVRNPDGSRYWDWATVGGPSGHRLMSYDEQDDFVYVSSSVFVISKETLSLGYFDEQRGFYQAEDVEFSQRLKSKGASIEICQQASALHDDLRYTQFDDYPRRISDFNVWEEIAPGISARGLYPWDGRAYPLSQETQYRLVNNGSEAKSFCFTLVSLEADNFPSAWKCELAIDGLPFAELPPASTSPWALRIPAGCSRIMSIKCSDVTIAFCKGAYRDQRAIGAYLIKPTIRDPQAGDLSIEITAAKPVFSILDQSGFSIFAPCLSFGNFAASTRALLRQLEESKTSFGLELHSVDHWFSQLCFGFQSSSQLWGEFLKRRKYCGVNLVCAEADKVGEGFFQRSRTSRRGYQQNVAITSATENANIIEELKSYDFVYVFDQNEAAVLASRGLSSIVLSAQLLFPKGNLINKRSLPNQRTHAVTLLLDNSSVFEPSLERLISKFGVDQDISIVIYVVDSIAVLQKISKQIEAFYIKFGQLNRMAQTIISAGTLESIEELEFLNSSKELVNLLAPPFAQGLELRLRKESPESL